MSQSDGHPLDDEPELSSDELDGLRQQAERERWPERGVVRANRRGRSDEDLYRWAHDHVAGWGGPRDTRYPLMVLRGLWRMSRHPEIARIGPPAWLRVHKDEDGRILWCGFTGVPEFVLSLGAEAELRARWETGTLADVRDALRDGVRMGAHGDVREGVVLKALEAVQAWREDPCDEAAHEAARALAHAAWVEGKRGDAVMERYSDGADPWLEALQRAGTNITSRFDDAPEASSVAQAITAEVTGISLKRLKAARRARRRR